MKDNDLSLTPEMERAGAAVARLSEVEPPRDLVARTMARIKAQYKPVKRVFWLLRPITNPMARLAAAAIIIFAMAPMTSVDWAEPLGKRIEQGILGRQAADQVEGMIDHLLVSHGTPRYSQSDLDATVGVPHSEPITPTVLTVRFHHGRA